MINDLDINGNEVKMHPINFENGNQRKTNCEVFILEAKSWLKTSSSIVWQNDQMIRASVNGGTRKSLCMQHKLHDARNVSECV